MSQARPDNHRASLTHLLDFLADTPDQLAGFAAGLSEEEVRLRTSPELFSTLENICHLRDLELQGYSVRIDRILKEDQPSLEDFDGARVAAEGNYNSEDSSRALAAFRSARNENVQRLKDLAETELNRAGLLAGVGLITLLQLAELMREHDEGHLEDLRVLQQQLTRRRLSDASPI